MENWYTDKQMKKVLNSYGVSSGRFAEGTLNLYGIPTVYRPPDERFCNSEAREKETRVIIKELLRLEFVVEVPEYEGEKYYKITPLGREFMGKTFVVTERSQME